MTSQKQHNKHYELQASLIQDNNKIVVIVSLNQPGKGI
jgi:hypothetical protein